MQAVEQMFTIETTALPKPPKRMRITQFYSKRFYTSRIKPALDAEWAAISTSAQDKRNRINVLNSVTTEDFGKTCVSRLTSKAWLEGQRDAEHARELAEHQTVIKELENAPSSPETYPVRTCLPCALEACTNSFSEPLTMRTHFFQPFANLMAKKFGAAVSILMVCPNGTNNGEIELRR